MSGFAYSIDRRRAMAMAASAVILPMALGDDAMAATGAMDSLRVGRDQGFDNGWRFLRGAAPGTEAPAYDDSAWRLVDLPHDWSIEDVPGGKPPQQLGPFDETSNGGTASGFTQGGEGWYRKHFRVDGLPVGSRVEIAFDGIQGASEIWLNGQSLGKQLYGYTAFTRDLTPFLLRDEDNVLAVRVRNLGQNSRWYTGSGLYRQVTVDVTLTASRLTRWGVGAWTRRIADGVATIDIATRIEAAAPGIELVTLLRDARGHMVAEARSPAAGNEVKQSLTVHLAHLWSPADPYLHTLETELRRGATVIDRMVQSFGIRIVTTDPKTGMAINGERVILRGGCVHHDNGLLGAAAFAHADERRVLRLKARGFNAIRGSHNPSARAFREACDKHGMLLIEEAFDMWRTSKVPDDFASHFADHWQEVVTAMVLAARNSPSVIMWSIGNEVPDRATPQGVEWQWKLANAVRMLDPTRPVTAGINGVLGAQLTAGVATARPGRAGQTDNAATVFLDIPGYNYRLEDIELEHRDHPERLVYASETFAHDMSDYQALIQRAPYFLGEFLWTAMDYLGEAGIGATAHLRKGAPPFFFPGFPWVNAWCGDIDLIGDQKASSLARDVVWGIRAVAMTVQRPVPDGFYEHVPTWGWSDELACWNWPEATGRPLAVRVYTAGDRVDLVLNDKRVGSKSLTVADKKRVEFMVPYAPGKLEAVVWRDGKQIGREALETTGPPACLRLTPERPSAGCGRQALHYIAIDVLDTRGRLLPDEARRISLAIDGPADLVGFGSANPRATGSFQSDTTESFRGRAMAVLRSQGKPGAVRVEARAEGMRGAATVLRLA